jgi:hypothetical protein
MGIFVEQGYFCISLNVFNCRKVCKLAREFVSFFPPLFCSLEALVFRGPLLPSVSNSCGVDFNCLSVL